MTAFLFGRNEDGSPVRPVRRRINRGRVKVEFLTYVVGPPELHPERGGKPLFADIAVDHRNVASALVSISRSMRVGEVAVYQVAVCKAHLGYAEGVTLDEHLANLLAERDRRIPQFTNLRTLLGLGDPLASEPPPPAHAGAPDQVEWPPRRGAGDGGPVFDITRRPTPDDGFGETSREVEVPCEYPPKVPRTLVTVTLDKPNGPILGLKSELLPRRA